MAILKNLKLTTLTFLAIICLVASHAGAKSFGPGNPSRNFGGGLAGLKMFIELNLSETQRSDVMSVLKAYEDKRESTREKLREATGSLASAMQSEKLDEDTIKKAYRQLSSIREDMLILRIQMRSKLKALLTPEQLELLGKKRSHRSERIKNRLEYRLGRLNQ